MGLGRQTSALAWLAILAGCADAETDAAVRRLEEGAARLRVAPDAAVARATPPDAAPRVAVVADAAPPPSRPRRAARPGTASAEDLAVLRRVTPRFRFCMERRLAAGPRPAGQVTLELRVEATGQASGVAVRGVDDAELRRCLEGVVGGLRFPPADGGTPRDVRYPITVTMEAP